VELHGQPNSQLASVNDPAGDVLRQCLESIDPHATRKLDKDGPCLHCSNRPFRVEQPHLLEHIGLQSLLGPHAGLDVDIQCILQVEYVQDPRVTNTLLRDALDRTKTRDEQKLVNRDLRFSILAFPSHVATNQCSVLSMLTSKHSPS
jgi:hypothetical protein